MTAPAGHVATTVLPVGDDTHTVEYKPGELATDALTDLDAVALRVAVGMRPPVLDADADAERDADRLTDASTDLLAERDADTDAEAVTLKPRVGDVDGDRVGDTSVQRTYSANTAPPAPQPPDTVSAVLGVMEHEFWPRHVALTTAPLLAAPGHDPSANGPDGHAPVGLP